MRIVYFGWAILPAIIFAGMAWRALWIKLPEPEGTLVEVEDAPALFRVIEEVRCKLDTAPIHSVRFDGDVNAGFVQLPRFGIFGWTRCYLVIGVPLLLGLSSDDLKAILVHELGHFSRNHGRFASWIYSVNQTWEHFLQESKLRQGGANELIIFCGEWYLRQLRAHSFMLKRTHEYEADQCMAELCGKTHTAQSLVHLSVFTKFVNERVWPDLWRQAKVKPEPPFDVFDQMRAVIKGGWTTADDDEWRKEAFAESSDCFDYHPSLSERVAALDEQSEALQKLGSPSRSSATSEQQPSAADQLIGAHFDSIVAQVNENWRKSVQSNWRARYRDEQTKRKHLAAMQETSDKASATADEISEYARLVRELDGDEAAHPIVERALQLSPSHAESHLLLAHILFRKNAAECIPHAETAMKEDSGLALQATLLVENFLTKQGKQQEATEYLRAKERKYDLFGAMERKKRHVSFKDRFSAHGLTNELLLRLIERIRNTRKVAVAYLVTKRIDGEPPVEIHILGLVLENRARARTFSGGMEIYSELVSAGAVLSSLTVVILDGSNRRLKNALRCVTGSQIIP